MTVELPPAWRPLLEPELKKPYFSALSKQVAAAYKSSTVYPAPERIFAALTACPPTNVRVVILGQDPYHGEGQAHGLSFSVPEGIKIPPSLRNIYKEIAADIGTPPPASGNLERWAAEGVLLLNATLTVTAEKAGSHQKFGWEQFTDALIANLSHEQEHLVFLLWGRFAQSKAAFIDTSKHLVLTAAHPSPLSAHNGFFGCRHFSQCNAYLTAHKLSPITW